MLKYIYTKQFKTGIIPWQIESIYSDNMCGDKSIALLWPEQLRSPHLTLLSTTMCTKHENFHSCSRSVQQKSVTSEDPLSPLILGNWKQMNCF